MQLFEQEFKDSYLKYHTNTIPDNQLDPRVFYVEPEGGDPKMLPAVKLQIINDIDNINTAEGEFNKTRVFDYIVFGQILKEGSSEKCPITVLVQINKTNLEDVLKERILNNIKNLNGKIAPGTLHPIMYIPTVRDIDLEAYAAVYHPYTDKWLKKPRFLGETKSSLDKLHKDPVSQDSKKRSSLKKGIKKIAFI
jgi:hypothetical protein